MIVTFLCKKEKESDATQGSVQSISHENFFAYVFTYDNQQRLNRIDYDADEDLTETRVLRTANNVKADSSSTALLIIPTAAKRITFMTTRTGRLKPMD